VPALKELGKRIREKCRERELARANLSKITRLSKSLLSQVERDLTQPSNTSLKKIAVQFGFSVVNLFSNDYHLNSGREIGTLLRNMLRSSFPVFKMSRWFVPMTIKDLLFLFHKGCMAG